MGNNNTVKAPSHSFWGILLGQFFKQKEFIQACPQIVKDEVNSIDLTNKRYLVTGASSGIGKEITKILARQGAHVIMASRSLQNLEKASEEIMKEIASEPKKGSLSLEILDLSDVQKVVEFCENFVKKETQLDGLINNGGALPMNQVIKNKEIEETVAVHIISPFILSVMLLPILQKSQGRIVHNSSAGAYSQKLYPKLIQANFSPCVKNKDTLQYQDGTIVYAQAKRAMIELSNLMGDHFAASHQVLVTCAHPGWCETPGLKPLLDQHESYKTVKFRPALDGAYGVVWCAISQKTQPSQFYYDGQAQKQHQTLSGTESNPKHRQQIWDYCSKFLPESQVYNIQLKK